MKNSYTEAMRGFDSGVRREIESRLFRWSTEDEAGREIVRNINPLERFLPPSELKDMLYVIYRSPSPDPDDVARSYGEECHRHVLKGGPVKSRRPAVVGRAVEREDLVNQLYNANRAHLHSPELAEAFVNDLVSNHDPTDAECGLLMSQFASWVTWDATGSGGPFDFRR